VDRKGRKFLLVLCTAGITVSLVVVGVLFLTTEKRNVDRHNVLESSVGSDQTLTLLFDRTEAGKLLAAADDKGKAIDDGRASLSITYSYGDFTGATNIVRSDDKPASPIRITRQSCVPVNKLEAFFKNPFADLEAARVAPLKIDRASIGPVPDATHGWLVAIALYVFMAFYALGPGVCVWLALSELMPTRIRSNGMSIALVINQVVSTTLAAIFLPVVSKYGYSTMFFLFAGFTVAYFITAAFFLPETKGKTLEEIEAYFGKTASAVAE
jgi:MFS transporter, SP family, solute carrier family 2 (myo-inositol transporter), member 13